MIAFFINLALVEIGEEFDPLCVYGFNVNSRSVLIFVRNGLLSKKNKCSVFELCRRALAFCVQANLKLHAIGDSGL